MMEKLLTKLIDASNFVVDSYKTAAFNVAATGYTSGTLQITKTGYKPVGIIGHTTHGSGSSFVSICTEYLSSAGAGTGDIDWAVRGTRSSAISGMQLEFWVLWRKLGGGSL